MIGVDLMGMTSCVLALQVKEGLFEVVLPPDTVATISTIGGKEHSSYEGVPDSGNFPVPYSDNFESMWREGGRGEREGGRESFLSNGDNHHRHVSLLNATCGSIVSEATLKQLLIAATKFSDFSEKHQNR